MARKKWTAQTNNTDSILKLREKRKWQIALRRYIIDRNPCSYYAPFFGIDIENFRGWISAQFEKDLSWQNFAVKWQFDHIVPVNLFDFALDDDMSLCWNFTNIRIQRTDRTPTPGNGINLGAAKNYFSTLFQKTKYRICQKFVEKITELEFQGLISTENPEKFFVGKSDFLNLISSYSAFEFDLLNSGRPIGDVMKEISFFKNI